MLRSSPMIPSAVSTRRWRTQGGASCLLFMAPAPAGEEVDAPVDQERGDEEDERDGGRAAEVEFLQLVHDQERRDLGLLGPGDEDDGTVLAHGAREGEGHARQERGQDAGE